ncbi:hypothetical protein JL49_13920 [Pseudoalteromonas luteoviolacea]|nr:hypothetical protein JL49_13920 [Pseudoalteromonas luteoviolacea]
MIKINKKFLLSTLLTLCSSSSFATERIADIQFADGNFRNCVQMQADANGWTYTDQVTELNCTQSMIKRVDELKYFSSLKRLNLALNYI